MSPRLLMPSRLVLPPEEFCFGHEAQPRSDLTAIVEALRVADGFDQRARCERPDAWNLGKLAAEIIAAMPCLDLCLEFLDVAIQILEVIKKSLHEQAKRTRQFVKTVLDQLWNARCDVADALRNDDAGFTEEPANLISLSRARSHEALTHTVQCEDRLLLDILYRYETHVRPSHRFADRLGIGCIVLVGLDVRLDELRCHQPHAVSHALKFARPVVAHRRMLPSRQGTAEG